MIFCYTGFALGIVVFLIFILVQIVVFIKDCVKKYRNRSNNCGDGAPEETRQGVVEGKKQDVTEGEDKDKESFV